MDGVVFVPLGAPIRIHFFKFFNSFQIQSMAGCDDIDRGGIRALRRHYHANRLLRHAVAYIEMVKGYAILLQGAGRRRQLSAR